MARRAARERALAGGGRAVDRDDHRLHPGGVDAAPRPFISGGNSGKLVAIIARVIDGDRLAARGQAHDQEAMAMR